MTWNSNGVTVKVEQSSGTLTVEQSRWNSQGGTVKWNSNGETVKVEQ